MADRVRSGARRWTWRDGEYERRYGLRGDRGGFGANGNRERYECGEDAAARQRHEDVVQIDERARLTVVLRR
jgi:hypothetical protein